MSRFRCLCLVLTAWWGLTVQAQTTLQNLWARHDAHVMSGNPKSVPVDPARSFTFKGRHGQTVRGWDVGESSAPIVLWWQGGPGLPADPENDSFNLADPKAYRHLEIDQPGTGQSEWVPGWKPEDTIEDAISFLRLRGVTSPVLVCGWSWGSTMALLFAQRHPEWVRGVVVGGVWGNSPAEVRYYLDAKGPRSWVPGLTDAFTAFSTGVGAACDLHQAIREGIGGVALAQAYVAAESIQCRQGLIPRKTLIEPVLRMPPKPVDLATERDDMVRFAYIESEMMCRGQRGEWRLKIRFPKALATVPLIVIQGRYDQVCDPEIARRVYRAWPAANKRFVPMNGGHVAFSGPSKDDCLKAGLNLTPDQETQLAKASRLHFGSPYIVGAAIDSLAHPDGAP